MFKVALQIERSIVTFAAFPFGKGGKSTTPKTAEMEGSYDLSALPCGLPFRTMKEFSHSRWTSQLIAGMLAPAQYWHDPLDQPGYVAGGKHDVRQLQR